MTKGDFIDVVCIYCGLVFGARNVSMKVCAICNDDRQTCRRKGIEFVPRRVIIATTTIQTTS